MIDVEGEFNWRDFSSCRNSDPNQFAPLDGSELTPEQQAAAKAVCVLCEVKLSCLNYAIATRADTGIWGGLNYEERLAYVASGRHRNPEA